MSRPPSWLTASAMACSQLASEVTSSGTNPAVAPDGLQRVGARLAEVLTDIADDHRRTRLGQRPRHPLAESRAPRR